MRKLLLLLILIPVQVISGCSHSGVQPSAAGLRWPGGGTLLLRQALLVDPARREIRAVDILIESGRLKEIAPRVQSAGNVPVVELAGRYFVLPGLIDLHMHAWGNPSPTGKGDQDIETEKLARLLPRAGVTEFLDLGGAENERLELRDKLKGSDLHAEMHAAGPVFVQAGKSWRKKKPIGSRPKRGEGGARLVASPDDARVQVRELALKHPDVIKVIYDHSHGREWGMSRAVMTAIVSEAHHLALKTVVHIGTWRDAREAILAGATAITHLYDDEVIPADLPALYASHHTFSIPTMAVQCEFARNKSYADPLWLEFTTPALRAAYLDTAHYTERAKYWEEWQADWCVSHDMVSLAKLSQEGVAILTGTDAGNLGIVAGYSIHRELALMVEAGLSPWQALWGATSGARAFLGEEDGLAVGSNANLLILNSNPVSAIAGTQSLEQVLLHGRPVR